MHWGRLYAILARLLRICKKVLRRHKVQPNKYRLREGCFGKSHGLACQGKPPLQRHGSRRFVLVLALVLALVPGVAYAATGSLSYDDMAVVWGPNYVTPRAGSGVIGNGVLVCANSKYNAALVTLGISVTDSRLTHDVKAKLSNESTGGAFYTFAQLFDAYKQSDGFHYPPWGGLDNRMVDEYAYLVGDEWLYFAAYTDAQKASALEDLNAILDGGDIGGGGSGGGSTEDPYTYTLRLTNNGVKLDNSYNSGSHFTYNGTTVYVNDIYSDTTYTELLHEKNAPETITLQFGGTAATNLQRYIDNGYKLYIFSTSPFFDTGISVKYYLSKVEPTITKGNVTWQGVTYERTRYVFTNSGLYNVNYSLQPTNNNLITTFSPNSVSSSGTTTINIPDGRNSYYLDDGISSPVIPPTNWPETPEPTTPTAPVVPAPGNVQITISSKPTFLFTWAPKTTITNTTTTYDSSDELRSIYDELVVFHLDSTTAYNSMIGGLNTVSQGITSLGTDMDNQFSWMFDNLHAVIDGNFHALKEYLRQLFEWLASQMDFTITGGGYNDATVVSWLKRIWSRLGSGINTRPNDPVANPGESVDWLGQFIDTLLGGLGDVVSSLAADVLGLVDDVHDKFPFSIPWDALAAFTSLAAVPTTPHFTFDYVIAGSHVVYDIDLAPYNDLAALARSVFIYFWGFLLLMKTTWLLDILGGATNMIGNFAVQALGG